jgi:hypothetical protein
VPGIVRSAVSNAAIAKRRPHADDAGDPTEAVEQLTEHRAADKAAQEIAGQICSARHAAAFAGGLPDKSGCRGLSKERTSADQKHADRENHTKDIDFSRSGIMQRWDAGYAHTRAVLDRSPWVGEFDPLSGAFFMSRRKSCRRPRNDGWSDARRWGVTHKICEHPWPMSALQRITDSRQRSRQVR